MRASQFVKMPGSQNCVDEILVASISVNVAMPNIHFNMHRANCDFQLSIVSPRSKHRSTTGAIKGAYDDQPARTISRGNSRPQSPVTYLCPTILCEHLAREPVERDLETHEPFQMLRAFRRGIAKSNVLHSNCLSPRFLSK